MTKVLLAKGARGELVRRVQVKLGTTGADGKFGGGTETAVKAFQTANGLEASGKVDVPTWEKLGIGAVPSVKDRALQLTGAFEGHGFTLAQGNFDGAGITWGIVGFTLVTGDLGKLLKRIQVADAQLIPDAFGATKAPKLMSLLNATKAEKLAFADSVSLGASKEKLAEPWRSGFQKLGENPVVQKLQVQMADEDYFQPAVTTAASLGLKTQLGMALAFDIHVQNGSLKAPAKTQIQRHLAEHPITKESELRIIVANAVADASKPGFQEDVRSRKLALATGAGMVHGELFVIQNWGLDESPV